MRRHLALLLMVGSALGSAGAGSVAAAAYPAGDGNPLGTLSQDAAEGLGSALLLSPPAQAGLATVGQQWRAAVQPLSPQSDASFADALLELGYASTVGVFYMDPERPQLLRTEVNAHTLFGLRVPGSLIAINNPDTVYRFAKLDSASRYVLTGKRAAVRPVDVNFSILDSNSSTVANIANDALVTAPDGSFTITLDASPADGRANHLQLPAGVSTLLKRDTISVWATQRPDALSIARVGGPAPSPLPDVATIEAQAVASEKASLASVLAVNALIQAGTVNVLPQPVIRTTGGFLASQANSLGHFLLDDDTAFVLTLRLGGAAYMTFPINNVWQVQPDWHAHTTSLNNEQALPNPDGTYTFVLSVKDPGVFNWIDPVGQHEVITQLRWQGLPATAPAGGGPAIVSQGIVPLSQLRQTLPAGTVYVTPGQRLQQQQERARSVAWRDSTG